MRRILLIPIPILAGLAVFYFATRHPQPLIASNSSIVVSTPGLVSAQAYMLPLTNPSYAPIRQTTVPDPVLDANAALVYHLDTDTYLYEKNIAVKVPIASLTKLLSALVVRDLFSQDDIVTVASASVRVDGQKQTLYEGERMTVHSLQSMMLVESSNDAAYALAQYAKIRGQDFVAQMNAKAVGLGMQNCLFTDPAGLDDTAYCTALDLARLVRAALVQAPEIWPIMATKELTITSVDGKITHLVKSTDDLLSTVPGIVGGKTGNTEGALGCLLMVVKLPDKHGTLITIVLGSRDRFGDTTTLLNWEQRAYHWQ